MISEPIRAAVISDTHGLLRPEVEKILQSCDVVIHAGDFDNQMVYHKLKIKRPLYAVRGNNDGEWAEQLPLIRRFALGGFSFLLVHDQEDIPQDVKEAQVIIFGHSHMHFQRQENGRLWLNPGSCGYRRFTLPLSLVVLTLEDEGCEIESIFLEEGEDGLMLRKESSWFSKPEKAKNHQENRQEKLKEREKTEKKEKTGEDKTVSGLRKRLRERKNEGIRQRDQLFVIAKIMRLLRRGAQVEWVADNMRLDPAVVEMIYRISVTHPQADAHQILDKLEVNHLLECR